MEGANVIIGALTSGATGIATTFVSLLGDLVESPVVIGCIAVALGYGLLKFAFNRLPSIG